MTSGVTVKALCNACGQMRQVRPTAWNDGSRSAHLVYLCAGCDRAAKREKNKRAKINVDKESA